MLVSWLDSQLGDSPLPDLRPVHTYAALGCFALVLAELVETEKCFY